MADTNIDIVTTFSDEDFPSHLAAFNVTVDFEDVNNLRISVDSVNVEDSYELLKLVSLVKDSLNMALAREE